MIELRRRYSGSKGSDSPSFSRLPKEYQEVEYLQGDGNAYIKTNIFPQIDDSFDLDMALNELGGNGTSTIVLRDSGAENRFGVSYNNSILYLQGNTSYYNTGYTATINERHSINYKWSNSEYCISVKKNNEIVHTYSTNRIATFSNLNCEIPLFCYFLQNHSNPKDISKIQIYSYIYYRNSELYAELIPCYRISDRVAGMYDIVNDVFYTNAGTGEFLYGPDVHYNIPSEYQQVEYLKGDGNAYIKADLIVNSEQEFEITFRIDDFSSIQMLFGISSPYYRLYSHSVGGTNQIEFQYLSNVWNQNIESGEKYTFKKVGQKYYLNDNELPIQLSSNFQSTQNFYIFSCNGEIGRYESKNYIYITKLHDSHFIPCYRRSDDVAGMYDLISGEFYTNAGTGEFTVGPDIIS